MNEPLLIYTTWPDPESARAFAAEAVEARLAACANILAPMTSVYRWQGAVEQAVETPMLLKTTSGAVDALRDRFQAVHPYETPAFVALPLAEAGSHAPYLAWIREETSSAS